MVKVVLLIGIICWSGLHLGAMFILYNDILPHLDKTQELKYFRLLNLTLFKT